MPLFTTVIVLLLLPFAADACSFAFYEVRIPGPEVEIRVSQRDREAYFPAHTEVMQTWLRNNDISEVIPLMSRTRFLELDRQMREEYEVALRIERGDLIAGLKIIEDLRLSRSSDIDLVEINSEEFPVISKLGRKGEGHVYLIWGDGALETAKIWDRYSSRDRSEVASRVLRERGENVPRVVETDPVRNIVRSSYRPGLLVEDVHYLYEEGHITKELRDAFLLYSERIQYELESKHSEAVNASVRELEYFNPSSENRSFDPHTFTWQIFDPH